MMLREMVLFVVYWPLWRHTVGYNDHAGLRRHRDPARNRLCACELC